MIFQKQNEQYKEAVVILTLKCENLEKELIEVNGREGKPKGSYILSQSPNSLEFNSVEFDLPKEINILSGSLSSKNLTLVSRVIEMRLPEKSELKQEVDVEEYFDIGEEEVGLPQLMTKKTSEAILIRSEYLQKWRHELQEIICNKEESFSPSFYNFHSNSAIEVLDSIKFQLFENKHEVEDSILQELAFVEKCQTDFCSDVEPELEEFIQSLGQISEGFYSCV